MKRREFLISSALGSVGLGVTRRPLDESRSEETTAREQTGGISATRKILIAGGGFNTAFIRYMATLTGKKRPKLLYLPTASADSPSGTITGSAIAPRSTSSRPHKRASSPAPAKRAAGKTSSCRWTVSSRQAATR